MLSSETENRLAKMLLILADGEASAEITRQVLNNQLGFDPYSLFRNLDTELKGWIDSINIIDFLGRFSIYCNSFDAQQIIFQYDADLSGTLSYSEFINMIISEKNNVLRNSTLSSTFRSIVVVPYDVEFSFARLLEKELDYVKCLNAAIRELNLRYDFNVLEAFKALDVYNIDNLNADSIRKFLIRNYISPSESDVLNIVKRLDIDRDYRVTYIEFKGLISCYSCGVSTCTHYSPLRRTYYSPFRTKVYYSPRRYYYSPLRSTGYYSPLRKTEEINVSKNNSNNNTNLTKSNLSNLNNNFNNTKFSPLRSTLINLGKTTFTTNSPKRVNSPPRSNTSGGGFNNTTNRNLSNSGVFSSNQNFGSNLLSSDDEIFLNYLKSLISIENSLEINKNEVALKNDLNMEEVFSIFEVYEKNYISEYDLKDGLNRYFGMFPMIEEISAVFKRYDTERNGSLR